MKHQSSASNRTLNQPAIDIGTFDDAVELDEIINVYVDEQREIKKIRVELSEESKEKANEIFDLFRKNKEDLVDEEMFVSHWPCLQGRISALEYFAVMDHDDSGSLSRPKFVEFWRLVKEQQGVTDDEIIV